MWGVTLTEIRHRDGVLAVTDLHGGLCIVDAEPHVRDGIAATGRAMAARGELAPVIGAEEVQRIRKGLAARRTQRQRRSRADLLVARDAAASRAGQAEVEAAAAAQRFDAARAELTAFELRLQSLAQALELVGTRSSDRDAAAEAARQAREELDRLLTQRSEAGPAVQAAHDRLAEPEPDGGMDALRDQVHGVQKAFTAAQAERRAAVVDADRALERATAELCAAEESVRTHHRALVGDGAAGDPATLLEEVADRLYKSVDVA